MMDLGGDGLPIEVLDKEEFIALSSRARECRIVKAHGVVKLKLRTRRMLYTIKVGENEAEELKAKLKCPIVDIS